MWLKSEALPSVNSGCAWISGWLERSNKKPILLMIIESTRRLRNIYRHKLLSSQPGWIHLDAHQDQPRWNRCRNYGSQIGRLHRVDIQWGFPKVTKPVGVWHSTFMFFAWCHFFVEYYTVIDVSSIETIFYRPYIFCVAERVLWRVYDQWQLWSFLLRKLINPTKCLWWSDDELTRNIKRGPTVRSHL